MRFINSTIIAHRGASALAPENTLAAFKKASEIGATWVEFDVMLAADGEVVVIHDETLNRTTNGSGLVADFPYTYLATLDAGSWFDPVFKNEKIPTLRDVLLLLQQYQLNANIEIKPALGHEIKTVKKIHEVIEACWRAPEAPLVSSFSLAVQHEIKKYFSTISRAFLMDEWNAEWKKILDELDCKLIGVNQAILDAERIQEIKAAGNVLLSYTVDDPAHARKLFSLGVDAIFSNCPLTMQTFY